MTATTREDLPTMKIRPPKRRYVLRRRDNHKTATHPVELTDQRPPYYNPPSDGTCHFFRLPAEVRVMIYDFATRDCTFFASSYEWKSRIFFTRYKAECDDEPRSEPWFHGVPERFAGGHAVNRRICEESLPLLIRNATFDFNAGDDFEALMEASSVISQHITSVRVHVDKLFSDYRPINLASNMCPNLTELAVYLPKKIAQSWFVFAGAMCRKLRNAGGEPDISTAVKACHLFELTNIRGLTKFRLLFVDASYPVEIEWWREHAKAYISIFATAPRPVQGHGEHAA